MELQEKTKELLLKGYKANPEAAKQKQMENEVDITDIIKEVVKNKEMEPIITINTKTKTVRIKEPNNCIISTVEDVIYQLYTKGYIEEEKDLNGLDEKTEALKEYLYKELPVEEAEVIEEEIQDEEDEFADCIFLTDVIIDSIKTQGYFLLRGIFEVYYRESDGNYIINDYTPERIIVTDVNDIVEALESTGVLRSLYTEEDQEDKKDDSTFIILNIKKAVRKALKEAKAKK